jgi:hypothetical protein
MGRLRQRARRDQGKRHQQRGHQAMEDGTTRTAPQDQIPRVYDFTVM